MKLEKVKLVEAGVPTSTNRIYLMPLIEKMYKKLASSQLHESFGGFGQPTGHTVNQEDVAFTYENPVIEDNVLYVDINILDTPKGKELMKQLDHVDFKPIGQNGPVDENNVVQDSYELLSINAIIEK